MGPCQALQRGSGPPQGRPKGWRVSAHGGVIVMDGMYAGFAGAKTRSPLAKGTTIRGERRLALNASTPTESANIMLKEYPLALQVVTDCDGIPGSSKIEHWVTRALACTDEPRRQLTIRITGDEEIRSLNRQYRDKDQVTNVLSFPFDALEQIEEDLLGDVVISAPQVLREASAQDKPPEAHWAHMVIHGILHLCGYDHINNKDAEEMEGVEIKIMHDLGYPDPYQVT